MNTLFAALTLLALQDEFETRRLSTGLEIATPKKWKPGEVKSKMRLAQFALPPKEARAADGELVIYYFGKTAVGSADANIDRWVKQFKDATREQAKIEKLKEPLEITLFDLSGTYLEQDPPNSGKIVRKPDTRMLAAIVETPAGPHYLKLLGPAATVAEWAKEFRAFVEKLRFSEK